MFKWNNICASIQEINRLRLIDLVVGISIFYLNINCNIN